LKFYLSFSALRRILVPRLFGSVAPPPLFG
jgi:hypothetical protein